MLYINCCPRTNSRTHRLAQAVLSVLGDYIMLQLQEVRMTEDIVLNI